MKHIKTILTIVMLTASIWCISSCKGGSADTSHKTEEAKQGKEYTFAYICPMHCKGSGSDKEGDCPVCGMAYEKNKDHKKDDHDHAGHNH